MRHHDAEVDALNYCDLHLHSTASDGTDASQHLARPARDAGLAAFALTDHDTTAGPPAAIDEQRTKLDAELQSLHEGDEAGCDAIYERLDELDRQREELFESASRHYTEATKAHAAVFVVVDPDGRVRRECRMPRIPGAGMTGF